MYPYVLSVLNQFLHLLRVLRGLLNSLGYALSATAGAAVMNINFSMQMMLLHTGCLTLKCAIVNGSEG